MAEMPDDNDHILGYPRPLRVVCIGAGATGLDVAYKIKKHLRNINVQVYEKNTSVGGTWFENTYPGCACDIPAHIYQMSWAINPDWSEFYASGAEILKYLQDAARDHGLDGYIKLRHRVVGAAWDESQGIWQLKVINEGSGEMFSDWGHFLINATGFLNHWQWPDIEGLGTFRGKELHTAAWDDKVQLEGKRVGVIGNGSSGIQVVTAIQPDVAHLAHFLRNPTWIATAFGQEFAGIDGANFAYSQEQKVEYREKPEALQAYRKAIESNLNSQFKMVFTDSPEQAGARAYLSALMKSRLMENEELGARMIPDFGVGCRRPTPGVGYLEALQEENARIVFDPIAKIVEKGIELKTGEVIELDVIICATGFDVSFRPHFPIIGRNNVNLSERWKDRPAAYLSFSVPNFPNYFVFLGPYSPFAHGSAFPAIEHTTRYLLHLLFKFQTECYKAVEPKQEALDDFINHADHFLTRTVFAANCRSWFKGGKIDGPPMVHPGSRIHWFHMLTAPRWEDWNWTAQKANRFAYLGNGFSSWEEDGRDKAWYMDEQEHDSYDAIKY